MSLDVTFKTDISYLTTEKQTHKYQQPLGLLFGALVAEESKQKYKGTKAHEDIGYGAQCVLIPHGILYQVQVLLQGCVDMMEIFT